MLRKGVGWKGVNVGPCQRFFTLLVCGVGLGWKLTSVVLFYLYCCCLLVRRFYFTNTNFFLHTRTSTLLRSAQYKSTVLSHVKTHKSYAHNINVTYFNCGEADCTYKAKTAGDVKTHKAMIHDIDVTFYLCDFAGCDYKAKKCSSVKRHKQNIHDIDVVWHKCTECNFQAKMGSSIKQHMNMLHNDDVVWHECLISACEFTSKHLKSLEQHRKNAHGIKTCKGAKAGLLVGPDGSVVGTAAGGPTTIGGG